MKNNKLKTLVAVVLSASVATMISCGGDTDGGKAADEDFQGSQFVPNEENSGRIDLTVNETELDVASVTGFFVQVRDSAGAAVPLTQIACDSEAGVAIIEPTTGFEITDAGGAISGKIGCAAPGSYQFGCRLPVGGNLRKFVTIKCTGAIPTGFDGFSGSAGGGLGTGGSDSDDDAGPGGTNTDGIRVIGVQVDDTGATDERGLQVDTSQDICETDDPATPEIEETIFETFGDAFLEFRVINNTNSAVKFTSLRYTVPGVGSSSSVAFIGDSVADGQGAETVLTSFGFSAIGSGGSDKFVIKGSSASNIGIPNSTGVKNVSFTLTGQTAQGDTVSVSGTTGISFGNYNRCG